jgi:hypothetical protein
MYRNCLYGACSGTIPDFFAGTRGRFITNADWEEILSFWEWKYSEFLSRWFWLVTCNFILRRRTKQRSQRLTRASFCFGRCKVNDRHSETLSSASGWQWLRTWVARTRGSHFGSRSGQDIAHSQPCRRKRMAPYTGYNNAVKWCHWN